MVRNLSGVKNFSRVFWRGKKINCGVVVVHILFLATTEPLVGFVVPKRVGGAVVRNKIKRQLRSLLRDLALLTHPKLQGAHIVFRVVRQPVSFDDIRSSLERLERTLDA